MAKKLSDDGEQTVSADDLLHHYQRIRAARRAKDKAVQEAQTERSRFTAVVKAAKKAGVDMRAIELKEEFEELGLDAARKLLATVATYTAWDGNGEQLQMFDGLADGPEEQPREKVAEAHARQRAWDAGHDHAKDGGALEACPLPLGSELNQCWTVGWRDATAATAKEAAGATPDAPQPPKKVSTRRGMPAPVAEAAPAPIPAGALPDAAPAPLH